MTPGPFEQKNCYKGFPERSWVWLRLAAPDGTTHELEFLADTGNPCAAVISQANMVKLKHADAPDVTTNFGLLQGGWLELDMPELLLTQPVLGYASDAIVTAAKASSPD